MILQAYFTYLRNRSTLGKDRKTIRMLESLIRMAEAHARIMHKNDIDIYDAVCVIILMEYCVCTGLYDELPPIIMSKQSYEKAKYDTLTKLGLTDFTYFEDEYDNIIFAGGVSGKGGHFGEDTAFLLETTNYDKTEMSMMHTAIDGTSRSSRSRKHSRSQPDDAVVISSQSSVGGMS
jgi:hypothetical protein